MDKYLGGSGIRFGNNWILFLLFMDDAVLLAPLGQDFCRGQICRISTSKSKAIVLTHKHTHPGLGRNQMQS